MGNVRDQENGTPASGSSRRCWQVGHVAAAWSAVFAAPHIWWAFGVPAGFPGGAVALEAALALPWFVAYDLLVVALSGVAALVALAAVQRQPIAIWLAWVACGVLLARGFAGLVVDGRADLVWNPLFVVGGLLFGVTVRECGRQASGMAPG